MSFQIANVTVVVDPTHKLPKRGVTPAECLILAALHRKNSNGMPLEDLVIQPGVAETIDIPAKPAVAGYFDQHAGRHIDAVKAKPAVTHKRTQSEEIERLRRAYPGQVDGKPAFEAVFGSQARIVLPETFDEVSAELGVAPKEEGFAENVLRNDGPTLEEYVAAGYDAANYPPSGYLAKASEGWTAELEMRKALALAEPPEGGTPNEGGKTPEGGTPNSEGKTPKGGTPNAKAKTK